MVKTKDKYISADSLTKSLFILIQMILFALVFTTRGDFHKMACFGCVVNPFAYSLKFLSKDKLVIFTQLGLLFTVFSDLFLIVIEPQYKSIAMVFFAIAQICYFLRLLSLTKRKILHIILRIVASVAVIVVTIFVLKDKVDFLSLISMFYYANLVLNLIYAIGLIKKSPLFAIGLLLFLLCDTLIGLEIAANSYIFISETSIIYKLTHAPINLAWIFYVPSQAFIALSLHNKNK